MYLPKVFSLMRLWGRQLTNMEQTGDTEPFLWEWEDRAQTYTEWEKMYANKAYDDEADDGLRQTILKDVIGRDDYADRVLAGLFNPVAAIVDCYQNCLGGQWGKELLPEKPDGTELATTDPVRIALDAIWRNSNLQTTKQILQTWAALYGTVGLRITADPTTKKVRIHVDRPSRIVDFDEDADGNITDVLLRYEELRGDLGEKRRVVNVEERISKERISRRVGQTVEFDIDNELRLCPYVLLRHKDVGSEFGVPAFWGTLNAIHWINWRLSRQDESVDRHQFPQWFGTGAGTKPAELNMNGETLIWSQTGEDETPANITPLVPQIQHDQVGMFIDRLESYVIRRQPELVLGDLKSLSGQSGETIAKLLVRAESAVKDARVNYEHALVRAMQIGLSWAAHVGALNTNGLTPDQLWESGTLDFRFRERPALPTTAWDRVQQATADTARRKRDIEDANAAGTFVSRDEQLRIAGYSDEQIDGIKSEIDEQDTIPAATGDDSPIPTEDDETVKQG